MRFRRLTARMAAAHSRLTESERAEYDRFLDLARQSNAEGFRLDAWAYSECANDILEKAAGIRRCSGCGRLLS